MLIAPEKICFGRWQLDAQRRTLLADGTPVALNGRAFDLLELLVARRGQAVTRDELIAHVWQDVTVGENNLTVQMSYLRKVLSDGRGDGAGLILTVPRGYKFAGEVEELPVPAGLANKGRINACVQRVVHAGALRHARSAFCRRGFARRDFGGCPSPTGVRRCPCLAAGAEGSAPVDRGLAVSQSQC